MIYIFTKNITCKESGKCTNIIKNKITSNVGIDFDSNPQEAYIYIHHKQGMHLIQVVIHDKTGKFEDLSSTSKHLFASTSSIPTLIDMITTNRNKNIKSFNRVKPKQSDMEQNL